MDLENLLDDRLPVPAFASLATGQRWVLICLEGVPSPIGSLHLSLENNELLVQACILGREIGAAVCQVEQAAGCNRDRGWFGPQLAVSVHSTAREGPENGKVKHRRLLELDLCQGSRRVVG